jgi:hypothetical protein
MNSCIVVPTIREKNAQEFLAAWESEFRTHRVIVVEDNPERTFALPDWVTHVSWKEIDADLKENAWIIPRRTGAIRNYGNLLASRMTGLDMIVNLDDDCMPETSRLLDGHWTALETPGRTLPVFDTMSSLGWPEDGGRKPRGYPKNLARLRTILNHGLWNGVPDIDGETQLKYGSNDIDFDWHTAQVPLGVLFPMSAMNIAFRPELLPAMYNLPMGEGQPFHRFDDIWCGLIMKKACDAMGWSVRSGAPFVRHVRASDAKRNAELEAPGIVENEWVWKTVAERFHVERQTLHATVQDIYSALSDRGEYWGNADRAAAIWRTLIRSRRGDRLPA